MANHNYMYIDGEPYSKISLSEILEEIESIASLDAGSKEKTLEAKLKAIKKLPNLVNDRGYKYKKYFNPKTLQVWYEML